jgi:hypothetical protein
VVPGRYSWRARGWIDCRERQICPGGVGRVLLWRELLRREER